MVESPLESGFPGFPAGYADLLGEAGQAAAWAGSGDIVALRPNRLRSKSGDC